MDKLTTYLPLPVHLKTEQLAEDRKQKNKGYYKTLSYHFAQEEVSDDVITDAVPLNWDHVERRCGDERRSQEKQRGKWLDSRAEKDRRQSSPSISVKI